jgi:hypothetical protein
MVMLMLLLLKWSRMEEGRRLLRWSRMEEDELGLSARWRWKAPHPR